jgi:hypothetical protein
MHSELERADGLWHAVLGWFQGLARSHFDAIDRVQVADHGTMDFEPANWVLYQD